MGSEPEIIARRTTDGQDYREVSLRLKMREFKYTAIKMINLVESSILHSEKICCKNENKTAKP